MREHPACPHCGQRMMYMRAGARLSPLKAKIFDAIKRAGPDGISHKDLIADYGLDIGFNCLRAHIWQINELLQRYGSTSFIASPTRLGRAYRAYRLVERKALMSKMALAKEKRI